MTLQNADVILASTGGNTLFDFVAGEQTLDGTGNVVFAGTSDRNTMWTNTGGRLTVAPGVTVRADTQGGTLGWANQQLTLQGTVLSEMAGQRVTVRGNAGQFDGLMRGRNGGEIQIEGAWALSAGGNLDMDGGELSLFGDWSSAGTIVVANGTADIGNGPNDNWQNTGSIALTASVLELGGAFALSDVGTLTTTGDVLLNGRLDNTGLTLDLSTALPGVLTLDGGAVVGGTLTGPPITIAASDRFGLEGIVLATDVLLENAATLDTPGGITLDNATITMASTGGTTLMNFVSGEQTLGGIGEIVFDGTSNRNTVWTNNGQRLTVGPNVALRTGTGSGTLGWSNQQLTVEGQLIADVPGQSITVDGQPATVSGRIEVTAGAVVNFGADLLLTPGAIVDLAIGGSADFGRINASGQSVTLDGTLNVSMLNGFIPGPCETFEVIGWQTGGGAFATENFPDLGGGATFSALSVINGHVLTAPGVCTGNLSLLPGVVATSSTDFSAQYVAALAIDGNNSTNSSWCTANNDPAPRYEVAFPADVTVTEINVLTSWSPTFDFLTGRFEIFSAGGALLYDSGVVALTAGEIALDVVPDISGARRVVFSGDTWNSIEPCFSEFEVLGSQP